MQHDTIKLGLNLPPVRKGTRFHLISKECNLTFLNCFALWPPSKRTKTNLQLDPVKYASLNLCSANYSKREEEGRKSVNPFTMQYTQLSLPALQKVWTGFAVKSSISRPISHNTFKREIPTPFPFENRHFNAFISIEDVIFQIYKKGVHTLNWNQFEIRFHSISF